MKGYRIAGLPSREAPVPEETGTIRFFSRSLPRARYWASMIGAGDDMFLQGNIAFMNGYVILEIEAEEVVEDVATNWREDCSGRIVVARPVEVVRYFYPETSSRSKLRCLLGKHSYRGRETTSFMTGIVVREGKCLVCGKQIRQEHKGESLG